ncbi:MAG: mechanosensitive ion channel [Candidatus Sericytochromatia bacterium]|nr:mechanosensitive ion channel [Candidatus Tanganyikabacteria bacterium]
MTLTWPIWFRSAWLALDRQFNQSWQAAPRLVAGVVVLLAGIWLARRLRRLTIDTVHKTLPGSEAALPLGQVVHAGSLVLTIAVTATMWGFGLSNVVTGLGVSGVVIGFALKDILENYLAGLMLMLGQPFRLGQRIRSGDIEGVVTRIATRSTTLEAADGTTILVPNARLLANPIINLGNKDRRRESLTFPVPQTRSCAVVREQLHAIVDGLDPAGEAKPEVRVVTVDATHYTVEVTFWTAPAEAAGLRSRVLEAALARVLAP